MDLKPVDALPTENISTSTIYLLKTDNTDETNIYEEWIYVNSKWELIGTTEVDLSNYATKSDLNNYLSKDGFSIRVSENTALKFYYNTGNGEKSVTLKSPTIPKNTSQLTNDSGFVTKAEAAPQIIDLTE